MKVVSKQGFFSALMENALVRLKMPNTQDIVGDRRDLFIESNFDYCQAFEKLRLSEALSTHTDPSALGGDLLSGTEVLSHSP